MELPASVTERATRSRPPPTPASRRRRWRAPRPRWPRARATCRGSCPRTFCSPGATRRAGPSASSQARRADDHQGQGDRNTERGGRCHPAPRAAPATDGDRGAEQDPEVCEHGRHERDAGDVLGQAAAVAKHARDVAQPHRVDGWHEGEPDERQEQAGRDRHWEWEQHAQGEPRRRPCDEVEQGDGEDAQVGTVAPIGTAAPRWRRARRRSPRRPMAGPPSPRPGGASARSASATRRAGGGPLPRGGRRDEATDERQDAGCHGGRAEAVAVRGVEGEAVEGREHHHRDGEPDRRRRPQRGADGDHLSRPDERRVGALAGMGAAGGASAMNSPGVPVKRR